MIDIHTGAILALASYPTFDPGIFNPDTPIFEVGSYIAQLHSGENNAFTNRATQEQYSPGSTFPPGRPPNDTTFCSLSPRRRRHLDRFAV